MSPLTLNHETLKQLAIDEFLILRQSKLALFTFSQLVNHPRPCIYGKFSPDVFCPNSLEALKTIHFACPTVIGNAIENNGTPLPRSIVARFIDCYGKIIVTKVGKESVLADTVVRQHFFLTPLETFLRFPNDEVGRRNEQFLKHLFA